MDNKTNTQYRQIIYFGEDFQPILTQFKKFIKRDKNFISLVPPKQKNLLQKRGYFSFAVKKLIEDYVTDKMLGEENNASVNSSVSVEEV
jgi:hypothetical protein